MEKFTITINKTYINDSDKKYYVVFDISLNGIKVGEAEMDHSHLYGAMISSYQSAMNDAHLNKIKQVMENHFSSKS